MAVVIPAQSAIAVAIKRVFPMDSRQVAGELARLLGLKMTAAIGGVGETRRASDWAKGVPPRRLEALKAALQATYAITTRYDEPAARSWFASTNPRLGMRSPLAALRAAEQPEDYDTIVACAVQDVS
jgi:hypothetical protein